MGSGREAYADWRDGDYVGAFGNGLLVVSDLVPGGALVKVGGKAAIRGGRVLLKNGKVTSAMEEAARGVVKVGKSGWPSLAYDLRKTGVKGYGQHGHHWAIPQKAPIPDRITNQPWNIKVLDPEQHMRLHGRYKQKPRYDPVTRVWIGTPNWAKATGVSVGGRAVPGRGEDKR